MKRIIELDGVRALAVGTVILDHYAPFRNFANSAPARYGGLGVDIFFVLSGFLITTILLKAKGDEHPYRVFYARRFLRILPAYLLLLLLVYSVGMMLHEPLNKRLLAAQLLFLRSFKGTGVMFQNVGHFLAHFRSAPGLLRQLPQAPLPSDYGRLPMSASLGPTWSLSVEEWFYVLWAPVVLLLPRRSIGLIAVAACTFGFAVRWLGGGSYFFASVDVLVAGALLSLWMQRRDRLPEGTRAVLDRCVFGISACSLIALITLSFMNRATIARSLMEVAVFGALAWLIQHSGTSHPIARLLRWRPLVYIGGISYMIYLIHLPLYFVIRHITDVYLVSMNDLTRMWLVAVLSIVATLLFSVASWKYFEGPILKHKDRLSAYLKSSELEPVPSATEVEAIGVQP